MTRLLIISFLCIVTGLGMVFWHSRKTHDILSSTPNKSDKFSGEMLSAIKEFYPNTPFAYDARSDMIEPIASYEGGHNYKFFLGNLRNRAHDMGRAERSAYIRETIMAFTDGSEITAEELKANLFLRARTGTELSLRHILLDRSQGEPSTSAVINRGDIVLELVMDIPNGVRMVDQETLEKHSLDMDSAVNLAATNLLQMTPDNGDDLWEKI